MMERHVLGISGGRDSAALAVYMRQTRPELQLEYFFTDGLRPRPRVVVMYEGKRRGTLVVTARAVFVNNARDFLGPGELGGDRLVGPRGNGADQAHENDKRSTRHLLFCRLSSRGRDS